MTLAAIWLNAIFSRSWCRTAHTSLTVTVLGSIITFSFHLPRAYLSRARSSLRETLFASRRDDALRSIRGNSSSDLKWHEVTESAAQ